jgi:hypothetical protein
MQNPVSAICQVFVCGCAPDVRFRSETPDSESSTRQRSCRASSEITQDTPFNAFCTRRAKYLNGLPLSERISHGMYTGVTYRFSQNPRNYPVMMPRGELQTST